MNYKFILLGSFFLLTLCTASAYTESPGSRKGIFFKDSWNRTWFLRASAISVSKTVAKDAKIFLEKPVVFNVTEF
jgi:hypothetical protein